MRRHSIQRRTAGGSEADAAAALDGSGTAMWALGADAAALEAAGVRSVHVPAEVRLTSGAVCLCFREREHSSHSFSEAPTAGFTSDVAPANKMSLCMRR